MSCAMITNTNFPISVSLLIDVLNGRHSIFQTMNYLESKSESLKYQMCLPSGYKDRD